MGLLVLITAALLNLTTPKVELSISVEQSAGEVYYAIYDSEETYMKEALDRGFKKVENGKITVVLDLKPGTYAITTFQDLNGNAELDSNWLGIPTEPYAFSNNAKGSFGPASFEDSKFTITEDTSLSINMK